MEHISFLWTKQKDYIIIRCMGAGQKLIASILLFLMAVVAVASVGGFHVHLYKDSASIVNIEIPVHNNTNHAALPGGEISLFEFLFQTGTLKIMLAGSISLILSMVSLFTSIEFLPVALLKFLIIKRSKNIAAMSFNTAIAVSTLRGPLPPPQFA